jgi:putative FmdB family regulatory protein
MPIYQYLCRDCGKITEKISKLGRVLCWCTCGGTADKVFCSNGGSFRKGQGYWADKVKGDI